MKPIEIYIRGAIVMGLVTALVTALWDDVAKKPNGIRTELFTAGLQLAVAAGAFYVTTVLVQRFAERRERSKVHDDIRRDLATQLNSAYKDIKQIRRMVKARSEWASDGEPHSLSARHYRELMPGLSEAQLRLEVVLKDIESSQSLYREYSRIRDLLKQMEGYVNDIVDEYEKKDVYVLAAVERLPYARLLKLFDFVRPTDRSRFEQEFKDPYWEVLKLMRSDLLFYLGKDELGN